MPAVEEEWPLSEIRQHAKAAMELLDSGADAGAEERLREAIRLAKRHSLPKEQAALLMLLAMVFESRDELEAAEGAAKEGLSLMQQVNADPLALAGPFLQLGSIRLKQGKFALAEVALVSARDLFRKAINAHDSKATLGLAHSLRQLADLRVQQGKPRHAEPLIEQALGLHQSVAAKDLEYAELLEESALISAQLDDRARALTQYREALALRERLGGEPLGRIAALRGLASVIDDTNPVEALALLSEALRSAQSRKGGELEAARVLVDLAGINRTLGNYEVAETQARRALHITTEIGARALDICSAHHTLGMILAERGSWHQARQHWEAALKLIDSADGLRTRAMPGITVALLTALGSLYIERRVSTQKPNRWCSVRFILPSTAIQVLRFRERMACSLRWPRSGGI